jgi:hypothetical protein
MLEPVWEKKVNSEGIEELVKYINDKLALDKCEYRISLDHLKNIEALPVEILDQITVGINAQCFLDVKAYLSWFSTWYFFRYLLVIIFSFFY